jgi:photosystem II stability/assembly factor-like uncharacterized protein
MQRYIIILSALFMCQVSEAQVDTIEYGLKGKIIRAFEQSSHAHDTYYAGLKGNSFGTGLVYKSTDGGVRWHALNNGLPIDRYVADIQAVAESNLPQRTLWAGTWKNGLYKSTDDGASWTKDHSFPSSDVRSIRTGIQHPELVYASTSTFGVVRSQDGGATWQRNTPELIDSSFAFAWSIEIDPMDDHTIYAQTFGDGVWRSTDRGDSWTQILTTDGKVAWDMNIANNGDIYVATSKRGDSESSLYLSRDQGLTWIELLEVPQIGINQVKVVTHLDHTRIYVGSWQDGVYQLMDEVWSKVEQVDHAGIAHLLSHKGTLLVGSWGNGVYVIKL